MNFTKEEVIEISKKYGPSLLVDSALDGTRVMLALSSNESSYGTNCEPRREPAYDTGGKIYLNNAQQKKLVDEFGSPAACSYGPWQMMFINFNTGTPGLLLADLDLLASEFVRFFNSYVIKTREAKTLQDIGQVWNLGHITKTPPSGVVLYCKNLQVAYDANSSSD